MQKKSIISIVVLVALVAGLGILAFSRGWISVKPEGNTALSDTKQTQTETSPSITAEAAPTVNEDTQNQTPAAVQEIARTEEIQVDSNTAEYELKCSMAFGKASAEKLSLEYYLDGLGARTELDTASLPELASISSEGQGILKKVFLNPTFEKTYLVFSIPAVEGMSKVSVYSVGLRDKKVVCIFSNHGKFSDIDISNDYRHIAFSYEDNPASSVFQEASLVEVISCENDKPIVRGSRTFDGKLIGGEQDTGFIYDYYFTAWKDNKTIQIKEDAYPKGKTSGGKFTELQYNIYSNKLLKADGTELAATAPENSQNSSATDSPAFKSLKDFYSCLADASQYSKGMGMLDSKFTIELDLLKQFNIVALSKSDIDVKEASVYSEILKGAKFDILVKEEPQKDKSVIYYYQQFSSGESQIRQALKAELIQKNGKWLILSIKECDPASEPFIQ